MKLCFFNDYLMGAVTESGVVDLSPVITDLSILHPQLIMNTVIEQWDQRRVEFEEFVESASVQGADDVRFRAPTPKPFAVVCMAVNYMENGTLKEKPPQQAFFKNSHSVIGDGDTMHLPDVPASIFEGEAELALVIGKKATKVPVDAAHDYIFGYMNFIDGSARGLSAGMGLSYFMKCQDDFAPLGPWITTKDDLENPQHLQVRQWVNGKLTHDYNTDDMAHNIAESLSFITANTTLEPGDVIALGTNHQGLHPFQDKDVVEQEIDGLGRLTIHITDELERTWEQKTRADKRALNEDGPALQLTGKYVS